jgi:hypothetical protein
MEVPFAPTKGRYKTTEKERNAMLTYLILDYWSEVSLHPEGPATEQRNQGFPWFFMVPEQVLSWY